MTPKEFVKNIEAYYGRYERPMVKATVLKYAEQYGPEELRQMYHNLIFEFSGQYKIAPDLAAIEKVRRNIQEDRGDGVYRNDRRIGHMDGGRFIPDLSILSPVAFEKYAYEYTFYDNPQGFLQLLEEDGKGILIGSQGEIKQLETAKRADEAMEQFQSKTGGER